MPGEAPRRKPLLYKPFPSVKEPGPSLPYSCPLAPLLDPSVELSTFQHASCEMVLGRSDHQAFQIGEVGGSVDCGGGGRGGGGQHLAPGGDGGGLVAQV